MRKDMKRNNFVDNDSGQMILLACVFVTVALVLIAIYEYSTLDTGENSINRENVDSFYYYKNIRDRYTEVYEERSNVTIFENELEEFALLHGYSLNFLHGDTQVRIMFIDKDLRIEEYIEK